MSDALSMSLDERIKLRKKEEQAAKKKGTKPTRKNAIKKAPRKTDRAGRKTKDSKAGAIKRTGTKTSKPRSFIRRTKTKKTPVTSKPKEIKTSTSEPQGKRRLRVSNLDFNITHKDLMELFSKFGSITKNIIEFDDLGRSKGIAIIEYEKPESAKKAIEEYNGATLDGKVIEIEYDTGKGKSQGRRRSFSESEETPRKKVPGIKKRISKRPPPRKERGGDRGRRDDKDRNRRRGGGRQGKGGKSRGNDRDSGDGGRQKSFRRRGGNRRGGNRNKGNRRGSNKKEE